MPKPQSKNNLSPARNPLENVEAPSTNALNNNRVREELFHLERTIANSERSSSDVAQCLKDLEGSVDRLADFIETLTISIDSLVELQKKFIERLEKKNA